MRIEVMLLRHLWAHVWLAAVTTGFVVTFVLGRL